MYILYHLPGYSFSRMQNIYIYERHPLTMKWEFHIKLAVRLITKGHHF